MTKAMITRSMVVVILFHCTSGCAEEVRVEASLLKAEPPLAIAPPPEAPKDDGVKAIEPTSRKIESLRKTYASLVLEEAKLLSMQELEKQIREKEAAMLLRKANALLERLVSEYGTTEAANGACGMLQKGLTVSYGIPTS